MNAQIPAMMGLLQINKIGNVNHATKIVLNVLGRMKINALFVMTICNL